MKTCPVCKQQSMVKERMGEGMDSAWYCTNSACRDRGIRKNLDDD